MVLPVFRKIDMTGKKLRAGFTIIELLFGLTLIAWLGDTLYRALHTTMRGTNVVESAFRLPRRALMFSRMMEKELTGIYLPEENYNPAVHTDKEKSYLKTAMKYGLIGKEKELHFTCMIPLQEPPEKEEKEESRLEKTKIEVALGDVLEVGYELDREKGVLTKRVDPIPDDKLDKGGKETELPFAIEELKFEYYDKKWESSWDTDKKKKLPRAIRIKVTFKDENDSDEDEKLLEHELVILLPNAADNRKVL
jgi:hypothetical protein